jgi:hypothetical protein
MHAIAQGHSGEVLSKKNDTNHFVRRCRDEKGKNVTRGGRGVSAEGDRLNNVV